ncbi:MAG: hypothetical protein L0206_25040, partial [Actinobacteria bacterium]|nr:hypothetical protein [Actinomycetota bacterium]
MQSQVAYRLLLLFPVVFSLGGSTGADAQAIQPARRVRQVDLPAPLGLAFDPGTETLLVYQADLGSDGLASFDYMIPDPDGSTEDPGFAPEAMAFEPIAARLVAFDAETQSLAEMEVGIDGRAEPATSITSDVSALGLGNARGMTVDPATGALFVLAEAGDRVVRIERVLSPEGEPGWGIVSVTLLEPLPSGPAADLRGLAFHPGTGRLSTIDMADLRLFELTQSGAIVREDDVSDLDLVDPRGLVFAPSGDSTDDPSRLSLYVADVSAAHDRPTYLERGGVVELAVGREVLQTAAAAEGGAITAATFQATLVQTIETSLFAKPSPDPSGIAYDPVAGRLVISDGEVEEMGIYDGANVWRTDLAGAVVYSANTLAFSDEPTGIAVDVPSNRYFVTDDNQRRVWQVLLGGDGLFGTSDDVRTSFSTTAFSCTDPEGIAFGASPPRLVIASGVDAEIFIVQPGANGLFDGVGDIVTSFDTEALGLFDPEGVEYDPVTGSVYIADHDTNAVGEATTSGALLNTILLPGLGADPAIAGVTLAPASDDPGRTDLYLVDRALDNDNHPTENDGKIYEYALETVPPQPGTLAIPIAASSDDAEESSTGSVSLTSS